uniref:Single-stranded DNA-binding protein n=1 Tax=Timema tahoe TaxID=61484 RepID=A0A7R9IDH9_9NEOP|nr:unnamed protein product [Timema tahoe]
MQSFRGLHHGYEGYQPCAILAMSVAVFDWQLSNTVPRLSKDVLTTCDFHPWIQGREEGCIGILVGYFFSALNEVTLLGRVGGEPQKRGTEEHPVVIFSLATHTNYKYDTGEFMQRTDWHRVCIFKPSLRDTVYNYLKKGQRVYVAGRLTYGEVKDEAGNPRPTTAVVADDVIFFQS